MSRTHGNCGAWERDSEAHVYCSKDGVGCWYSKKGNATKCRHWIPRAEELHLKMTKLVVDCYGDDFSFAHPIAVIACCTNGNRYLVEPSHIKQVQCAKWERSTYLYNENGISYRKVVFCGPEISIVVIGDSQIG